MPTHINSYDRLRGPVVKASALHTEASFSSEIGATTSEMYAEDRRFEPCRDHLLLHPILWGPCVVFFFHPAHLLPIYQSYPRCSILGVRLSCNRLFLSPAPFVLRFLYLFYEPLQVTNHALMLLYYYILYISL
ncbi:hypothetical protein V8F06_003456 [Rhypophila decipiens]